MSANAVRLEPIDPARLAQVVPVPVRDANKYTRGKLTVVGGSEDYPGSVCLASKAALFAGAGYVECATSSAAVSLVRAFTPSVVARSWDQATAADLGLAEADAHHPKACLVGPGMFADGACQDALTEKLIVGCACPLVLDGGAIKSVESQGLAAKVRARQERGWVTALTPHGGEAAALARATGMKVPPADSPLEALAAYAQGLADALGAVVLLKGPVSLIASFCSDVVSLMDRGTAALAKAGTGDVLAGMVGAFLAQGMEASVACVLAATVHAEAGHMAACERGIVSVTAEDVLDFVPFAIKGL